MNIQIRGSTFTLTGQGPMTRNELTAMIADKGGYVQGIARSTNVLVTNSIYSKSRKMRMAKDWGIPIIDYGELMVLLQQDKSYPTFKTRSSIIPKEVVSVRSGGYLAGVIEKVKKEKKIERKNLIRSIEI